MVDVHIDGGEQFADLARRLHAAAGRDVIPRAIAEAVAGTDHAQRAVEAGATRLPTRGGLAARVAHTQVMVRVVHGTSGLRVRFIAMANAVRDPQAINRGRVRHPVYGRWTQQPLIQLVPAGFFTDSIKGIFPKLRATAERALADVARRI